MTTKWDAAFVDGLTMYVRTYSKMRADAGEPMSIEEIIGALVSVVGLAIEQTKSTDYRRRLVIATHAALDERMALPFTPTSGAIN